MAFEDRLKQLLSLAKFSNMLFYMWDGNHQHKAWIPFIEEFH